MMSSPDLAKAAEIVGEAVAAAGLGVIGALARAAATADEKPMLRPGLFLRMAGDGSLGLGLWLTMNAMGYTGLWAFAASWIGGTLGYATIHDVALRVINRKIGS